MRDASGAQPAAPGIVPAALNSIPCTSAAFAELGSEMLRSGVSVRFRALGASMSPLVRDSDVVLVRPVEPGSIRVGDVVMVTVGPGRVLVHRVVERVIGPDGTRFTVQGDQVAQPDGTIPAAQVVGRVASIERGGARIEMDRPVMRWLGRLAVLRSRSAPGRGRGFRQAGRLVRRLPVLSRYLA